MVKLESARSSVSLTAKYLELIRSVSASTLSIISNHTKVWMITNPSKTVDSRIRLRGILRYWEKLRVKASLRLKLAVEEMKVLIVKKVFSFKRKRNIQMNTILKWWKWNRIYFYSWMTTRVILILKR